MSRRGRRNRKKQTPHEDKYSAKAKVAQQVLTKLLEQATAKQAAQQPPAVSTDEEAEAA